MGEVEALVRHKRCNNVQPNDSYVRMANALKCQKEQRVWLYALLKQMIELANKVAQMTAQVPVRLWMMEYSLMEALQRPTEDY